MALRVLVTGGTGYLGRAIVAALAEAGHHPVVFARHASAAKLAADRIDGDVTDAAALRSASLGCDAICHSAALVSIWRRRAADFDEVNVGGLANAIDAARAHGIGRLVYTSSFLALPPARQAQPVVANDYQRTKVAARQLAVEAALRGVPIVCVYPGVVYGPGVATEGNLVGGLLRDHRRGRLPGLVGGDRIWSFSYIGDVARGHVLALEKGEPGEHYGLGGENRPQRTVFELWHEQGGPTPPRSLPYRLASAVGLVEEWRARLTGRRPLATRGAIAIFKYDWPVDSRMAAERLGYRITPLADGVRLMLAELERPAG